MYTVSDEKTSIGDKGKELTYFDLIKICLNNIPQGGLNIEGQRSRIKVLDSITNVSPAKLEDAEFETLKGCVSAMAWNVVSKDIVEFSDYLKSLKPDKKS